MARKGILVSDPSFARTTRAQWLFEYIALRQKENEDREFWLKNAQRVAIRVLGLDAIQHLTNPNPDESDGPQDPLDAWIPFSYIGANHHLLNGLLKQMKGDDTEAVPKGDPNDKAFEELSRKLAESTDAEPFDDPFEGQDLKQLLAQRDAKLLGIQEIDPPKPSISVTSVEDE